MIFGAAAGTGRLSAAPGGSNVVMTPKFAPFAGSLSFDRRKETPIRTVSDLRSVGSLAAFLGMVPPIRGPIAREIKGQHTYLP